MAITHNKDTTKLGGGLRRLHRKKKKIDMGRPYIPISVGSDSRKSIRVRGGNEKVRLLKAEFVNLADKDKVKKAKIIQVVENTANPFFVRRNVITKGAMVETDKGYAKVTSRPGQDGMINAVLVKDYKPVKKK
ncbi:MAG: 30S ribosomal protein S8e [Candidatus Altiarchaeota archaeon]|nr:30S ribosomal protein S8e [Candidatus Altiarchaeota archaeon]